MTELIVIPDGVAWYVPFEALVATSRRQVTAPLVTFAKVRYAPTVGLAFSFDGAWRRVQRTGVVVGEMVPGEKPRSEPRPPRRCTAAVPAPFPLAAPLGAPSPVVASLLDALVVLDDVDADGPIRSPGRRCRSIAPEQVGMLDQWLALPGDGPQRILLPGMHTLAERGGKAPRRRGAAAGRATSCSTPVAA